MQDHYKNLQSKLGQVLEKPVHKMATVTPRDAAITPDDEPMDKGRRNVLKGCREKLVKHMDGVQVLQQMLVRLLFTSEEQNKLKAENLTPQQQCEELLDILPTKGAKAYEIFKEAIKIVHPDLTITILEAEIVELKSELSSERVRSADLRRGLNSSVKRGKPTKDELESLGIDIAKDWIQLGRRLGISDPKLQDIDHAHEKLPEKGYHMLMHWKQKEGAAATYQALCDALQHEFVQRQDLVEKFCYIKEIKELRCELMIERERSADLQRSLRKGRQTCSRCSDVQNELIALRRDMDEKCKKYEEDIKSLKEANEQEKKEKTEIQERNGNSTCLLCHKLEEELKQIKLKHNEEKQATEAKLREANARLERLNPVRVNELEKELEHLKTGMAQLELKDDKDKQALKTEEKEREAKLRADDARPDRVRVSELEHTIKELREEKDKRERQLLTDMDEIQKKLKNAKEKSVIAIRENERLRQDCRQQIKDPKKIDDLKTKIKALETKNGNLESRIKTKKSEIEQLRKEDNKRIAKANADSLQKIEDLKTKIKALKTKNDNLESNIKTKESEIEQLRKEDKKRIAKANADSLQKIEDLKTKIKALETKNDNLESKIKTKESERERLYKSIEKAKADSLQEFEDLKTKINALEMENDSLLSNIKNKKGEIQRLRKEDNNNQLNCKMLDKEVNKYKNAVFRAFLPSGNEFPSLTGVLYTLNKDRSVNLVATRSSDGPGEASDIFRHNKGRESGTAAEKDSWWRVDLGENYRLVITHYALRHGKKDGESILRVWKLQGSIDRLSWADLESANDPNDPRQFCTPSPYFTGRWAVKGEVRAFRFFRILQTGKNSSGEYGIYLSGIELYGALAKM